MSKFYGTLRGDRAAVTRTGNHSMTAAAQSYDGSVVVSLSYNADKKLMVTISTSEYSDPYGEHQGFYGTFEEFKKLLDVDPSKYLK